MPSNATAKIKSAPRAVVVLLFIVVISLVFLSAGHRNKANVTDLHVGGFTYSLNVADTPALRTKGLGDRVGMPVNQGMLFSYTNQDTRCFWMKDMHFSLDMIWLNAQHQVVYLQQNVSPNSFPHTFCSTSPAQYVVELDAGQAASRQIHLGQMLSF